MQKVQGFSEAGATTLTITGAAGTIAREVQGSYPSATITVYSAGTVTLATIYADDSGTAKANPFTADANGNWFFYVADGRYDVRFSGAGIAAPFTLGDLQAFDVQRPNLIREASQFSGADFGAKVTAAILDLPSTGGTVDARALEGAQSAASTITINKPVRLLLGATVLTLSGSPGINITSAGVCIEGQGETAAELKPGGNINLITIAAGVAALRGFSMTGVSATYATATGIQITDGHSQVIDNIRATDWGGAPLTVTADKGIFLSVTNSLLQVATAFNPSVVLSGTDTTPTTRHFNNVDCGGGIFELQGVETVLITNCSMNNVTTTASAKKVIMLANRITSVGNATTINGINHAIVGNVFAGALTIGSSVQGAVIANNVTVGEMTNNSTSTNNIIGDINSYNFFPRLAVGTTAGGGVGAFIGSQNLTGVSQYGLQVSTVATSAATSESAGIVTRAGTTNAAYTTAAAYGLYVQDANKGAANTITNLYGIYIAAQTAGGTNYGFYSAHTGLHVIAGTLNVSGLVTAANGLTVTGAGIQVGAPTAGDKGAGTINVQNDIYKNNTAYTNPDYVFERHFKGSIEKFLANPGAKSYRGLMPLAKLSKYLRAKLRLPRVSKASGLFERSDVLLEKLEEAYLYIIELHERVSKLESLKK